MKTVSSFDILKALKLGIVADTTKNFWFSLATHDLDKPEIIVSIARAYISVENRFSYKKPYFKVGCVVGSFLTYEIDFKEIRKFLNSIIKKEGYKIKDYGITKEQLNTLKSAMYTALTANEKRFVQGSLSLECLDDCFCFSYTICTSAHNAEETEEYKTKEVHASFSFKESISSALLRLQRDCDIYGIIDEYKKLEQYENEKDLLCGTEMDND